MSNTIEQNAGGIDPDRLYTYEELAELVGGGDVTARRVRRWVEEGKLPYTPLPGGRGRRVAGHQWLAYIRGSAVTPEAS